MTHLFHIGLIVLKSTAKPIIESAIEYYTTNLIKSKLGHYSKHQINSICDLGLAAKGDTYAAKVKGYYTYAEALDKLEAADNELANKIKTLALTLHIDDDFLIVSHEDAL